jgi:hypothetical protein
VFTSELLKAATLPYEGFCDYYGEGSIHLSCVIVNLTLDMKLNFEMQEG